MLHAAAWLVVVNQAQAPLPSRYSFPVDCAATVTAEARTSALLQFKAGEAAIDASKWAEAEASLQRAVALDPLFAVAHYGLGQTYMSLRRFPEAVQAFSTSRDAFRCMTWSAEERRQRADDIRDLREALRTADQRRLQEIGARWKEANGDTRTAGDKMRNTQDVERRLIAMEGALKEGNPAPPGVTLALGTALFQIGDLANAEIEFRAALARDPRSGDAHHNLALVCTLTDRLEEAEREIVAAEKAGTPIHPRLKEELERRKRLKTK